jgi:hypothetical protein
MVASQTPFCTLNEKLISGGDTMMKKGTLSKLGVVVAGCWFATGVMAAQPIEPPKSGPQTGGIPQCQADLAECTINLTEAEGLLQVCEDALAQCEAGQAFPATGQTTCWYFDDEQQTYVEDPDCTNPLTDGQDGDIQAGAELSYTETTYTVIDNNTKLEWMKQDDNGGDCASFPGYLDNNCTFTWDEAFAFVLQLNTEPCFAGHCDWRLPNRKELESILNLENFSPAVSAEFNTGCVVGCSVADTENACSCTNFFPAPPNGLYWSSTTRANSRDFAWATDFTNGSTNRDLKDDDGSVRAVRGPVTDQ